MLAGLMLAGLMLAGGSASAAELFQLPVDCTPGEDCWIAQYFDTESGVEAADHLCGVMTYDGHNGTDFAIANYRRMADGVSVLAVAPGVVVGARDGMVDFRGPANPQRVEGRGCGNSVVIDHGDGLVTRYCHMRNGSVTVALDDQVAAGDVLGLVGQSGLADFPHLHFTAQFNGVDFDPFTGLPADGCGLAGLGRWDPAVAVDLPYFAAVPYTAGFAPMEPRAEDAQFGRFADVIILETDLALMLWVDLFGVRAGDSVAMQITAPDGSVFATETFRMDGDEAAQFQHIGRFRGDALWPTGDYLGTVTVTRAGDGHVWTTETAVTVVE